MSSAARTFRIATRRSKMALAQTHAIIDALKAKAPQHAYELVEIVSDGCYDRFKGDLKQLGGKGAFTRALDVAILNGEADMAMHSMKDVPTDEDLAKGLVIGAAMPRGDIRDVAVCRQGESFVGLKAGAKVGTSSIRRAAQIKAHFPHLTIVPLRGNADTRIGKVDSKEVDAAILAKAGLERIGLEGRISEVFEPDMMMPSCAQGIVGVTCRADDEDLKALLKDINCEDSYTCLMAERAMLIDLGGNCHTPVGGYCEITKNRNLRLIALVASADGSTVIRGRAKMGFDEGVALGRDVAKQLLDQGAEKIIKDATPEA